MLLAGGALAPAGGEPVGFLEKTGGGDAPCFFLFEYGREIRDLLSASIQDHFWYFFITSSWLFSCPASAWAIPLSMEAFSSAGKLFCQSVCAFEREGNWLGMRVSPSWGIGSIGLGACGWVSMGEK